MKKNFRILLLAGKLISLGGLGICHGADDQQPDDRQPDDQVSEVIKTFKGRGAMADGSSPTPPNEAVRGLQVREGYEVELVLAEPDVEQPLSMAWDSRGRMWVVQYRQYQFPAGLKIVEYDNHLRAQFDKVPAPPPEGPRGKDVISVFEDTNGDGQFDLKKDVISGLNIATSVAIGAGGIWVANPPYLLFYPDSDFDDVPDSDPVVKLSGFGLEDTHSVMNSLKWGPDGWLYGANGSTTTGKVVDPASGDVVEWQGQMIWRFDPITERFEIYAEGGGNTFSLEIDSKGHVFSGTNNGKTRGMFYPQGSYGKKSWGKHGPLTNPYAFGYFHHMAHEGDDRRFAQAFAIEEGGLFQGDLTGRIVAPNSLHNVVWASRLERDGSTWRTVDEANLIETEDRWFRPVFAGLGMDGAIYMADWYDTRLSHVSPIDDWHKTSGRIYRLKPDGTEPAYEMGELGALTSEELVAMFRHPNRAVRRRAVLELGWRKDEGPIPQLASLVDSANGQESLEALWALHLLGGLTEERELAWLNSDDADIRRWVTRLIGDRGEASPSVAKALAARAASEPDVQVRVQLAASAKRLPAEIGLPMVDQLLGWEVDLDDIHQPLMIWWALEAHAESSREWIAEWVGQSGPWEKSIFVREIAGRLMRRYAMAGGVENFGSCLSLLNSAPDEENRSLLIGALQDAFEGLPMPELPADLSSSLESYAADQGESGLVIRLKSGDASAVGEAQKAIFSESVSVGLKSEIIRQLGSVEQVDMIPILLKVLSLDQASALKRVTLQTLAQFDDQRVAEGIIKRYGSTLPAEHGVRTAAERVLASRADWAVLMMDQVDGVVIKARDVSSDVVQLLLLHGDESLKSRVTAHWPGIAVGSGGKDLVKEIPRLKSILSGGDGSAELGRQIFSLRCATCHKLFDEGLEIGPDLTGYERQNLDFWIPAIVNPSLELREGYLNYVATMKDGRVLMGVMQDQSPRTVTIKDLGGQNTVISRAEIESMAASPISMMPPGLLGGLSDDEIRDLFAYLRKEVP